MKSLQIDFTPEEAARLERIAEMRNENKISVLAKRILMDYVRRNELQQTRPLPPPAAPQRIPPAGR